MGWVILLNNIKALMNEKALPIHYEVNIQSLSGHLFDIRLTINEPSDTGHTLSMASWIPGSYMIRDFAKNIVTINAKDSSGKSLTIDKLDKQQWQLAPSTGPIEVNYQVYAFDLSIRSAYICDEYAFFNGTSLFFSIAGLEESGCTIDLIKPKSKNTQNWRVATSLNCQEEVLWQFGRYRAENYLELIDHPVLIGEFDEFNFETAETQFSLVLAGGHIADTARITRDLEKICQHHVDFFHLPSPVSRYLFITLLCDSGFGGLEHMSSTALLYPRFDLPRSDQSNDMPDGYRTFLSLCSHEFFHTWLVKRMKPAELLLPDLSQENYTEQLWIYEGFTSYYDDLTLLRCGLITTESYLELLGQQITRLEINSGRCKQSITESSFDAWTRFYKQDEGAVNNIVSYYNKGAVLAFCLDSLIQTKSDGKYSLNDVLRIMWSNYQAGVLTDSHTVQVIVKESLSIDLQDFFDSALYSVNELPIADCSQQFGLSLNKRTAQNDADKGGKPNEKTAKNQFGASYKKSELGVYILRVRENTPAYDAGLQVGDRLIAIDEWQVTHENLQMFIDQRASGEQLTLSLLRDGKFKQMPFNVIEALKEITYLTVDDEPQVQQWINRS
jgi:predicted metalloprotease with PDZ domain